MFRFFALALLFMASFKWLYANQDTSLPDWLKEFERYAEQARKDWNVPGMAIAIVKNQEVIYAKGFGVKKLGGQDPVDPHTIFQIGSISKSFTTALIAALIDQKQVQWDHKVFSYLPNFILHDPWVTREFMVEDLFAQRSGLPGETGTVQAMLGYTTDQIMHHLRDVKPDSSFRAHYAYQNIFFDISAKVMQHVSEENWNELLKKRLLIPLQMNETSSTLADFLRSPNRAAWYHRNLTGETQFLPEDFPYANWVYEEGPAGGINSNVIDMSKWLMFHMQEGLINGQQLISQENMRKMHRPQIFVGHASGYDHFYALGWAFSLYKPHPLVWHTGGTRGASTIAGFDSEEKLGLVLLTNVAGAEFTLPVMFSFFNFYYGHSTEDLSAVSLKSRLEQEAEMKKALVPPSHPSPSLPLQQYAGTYANTIYGSIQIEAQDDKLVLTIGPKQIKMNLIPWDRDVFRLDWPYMEDEISFAQFSMDRQGRPTHLYMEALAESDPTFQRLSDK